MTDKDESTGPSEQVEAFQSLPGELLSGARRHRGWSRERVAQELNLDLETVSALEEDRFDALGAPVFARGHLRKYALILGLDSEAVLSAYNAAAAELPAPTGSPAPTLADATTRRGGGVWRGLLAVLIVVALGVLIWRVSSNGDIPGPDTATVDPGVLQIPGPGEPRVSTETFNDSPEVITLPAPPQTEDRRSVTTDTVVEPAPAPVTPEASGEDAAAAEIDVTRADVVESEPPPAPPTDLVRVELTFSADSWVEVRDLRGGRLLYQLGRQGDRRTIAGEPPLRVFLGFVDGVSITVDGTRLQIPPERRLGNTARFNIPLDATPSSGR
ncbi:MAG: RodZ domain-containing protein [Gammaproteobacteria bacterium]